LTIHQAKDYGRLVAQCSAFLSEAQLRAHFELYQGYVKKLNEIEGLLTTTSREGANYSFAAYSELRRREPVAYNGTFLHELYFGNLGPPRAEVPAAFRQAEKKAFGSWDHAMADLPPKERLRRRRPGPPQLARGACAARPCLAARRQ
jgi:Fe-Mn family superoxide dismutase